MLGAEINVFFNLPHHPLDSPGAQESKHEGTQGYTIVLCRPSTRPTVLPAAASGNDCYLTCQVFLRRTLSVLPFVKPDSVPTCRDLSAVEKRTCNE
jgi:hypothetical protein